MADCTPGLYQAPLSGLGLGLRRYAKALLARPLPQDWLQTRVKDVPGESALAAAKLLAEGKAVAFLARYRKDDGGPRRGGAEARVAAREVFDRMETRRAAILDVAERQKKRTSELEDRLAAATDLPSLEDLYLPLRKKRGATVAARKRGLLPSRTGSGRPAMGQRRRRRARPWSSGPSPSETLIRA